MLTCNIFSVIMCRYSCLCKRVNENINICCYNIDIYTEKSDCIKSIDAFIHTRKVHLQKRRHSTCLLTKAKTSEYPFNLPKRLSTPRNSDSLSSIHEEIRRRKHTLFTLKPPATIVLFRQSWILQTITSIR